MILGDGYIYVSISKTGSLSVRRWLLDHLNGRGIGPYHGTYVPERYRDGRIVFATVRNPYERARSMWQFCKSDPSKDVYELFEDMCYDMAIGLPRRQIDYINQARIGTFIKLEELHKLLNLPFVPEGAPPIGHSRKTPGHRYEMTNADRALVADLFDEDFKMLGYKK